MTIKSPCNTDCFVDNGTNTCGECGRTLTEIENWNAFSADVRKSISKSLKERKKQTNVERNTK